MFSHNKSSKTWDWKNLHMWGETLHGIPGPLPQSALHELLPCNSNNFASVIIMRDPLSRILSSDGMWTTTATEHTQKCNTDNYGLRWLIGKGVANGEIDDDDLVLAKARLDMFDVILITENFTETATLLCSELGWTDCRINQKHHPAPADILPADVLKEWTQRNHYDTELYKYAVQKSAAMLAGSHSSQILTQNKVGTKTAAISFNAMSSE